MERCHRRQQDSEQGTQYGSREGRPESCAVAAVVQVVHSGVQHKVLQPCGGTKAGAILHDATLVRPCWQHVEYAGLFCFCWLSGLSPEGW